MECVEHYCNSGSPVCGHLLNEGTRGSQMFVVPRSGNYTVTIAGASGGHGVCSNYSGLGVIVRETVQFRRGEILRILVGQQGTSACDGHQDNDVCQISNDTEACANLWYTSYRDTTDFALIEVSLFDGGGGGEGASLIEYNDSFRPIVIAPGGGGAGAIYNLSRLFGNNVVNDLEALYTYYTYAHAFETFSDQASFGGIGIIAHNFPGTGGPGAGYNESPRSTSSDPGALSMNAFGGQDYGDPHTSRTLAFPDTHGGFGGGGGGSSGGGGGGGYTGGSVLYIGSASAGEGGYSWPNPPWSFVGYNDGDGYVELFCEPCGCTYNCIIHNQSSFECSCPSDTLLALNGFDCYREGL